MHICSTRHTSLWQLTSWSEAFDHEDVILLRQRNCWDPSLAKRQRNARIFVGTNNRTNRLKHTGTKWHDLGDRCRNTQMMKIERRNRFGDARNSYYDTKFPLVPGYTLALLSSQTKDTSLNVKTMRKGGVLTHFVQTSFFLSCEEPK